MGEEIIVTARNGKVTIETKGFIGEACKDATRDLERAMGLKTEDHDTPEMHQREVRTIAN